MLPIGCRYYCLPYVVRSPEDVALRKKMKSRKQPKRSAAFVHAGARLVALPCAMKSPLNLANHGRLVFHFVAAFDCKRYFAALLRKIDVFWMDKRQDFPFHGMSLLKALVLRRREAAFQAIWCCGVGLPSLSAAIIGRSVCFP